jgi:arginine-tRNA-protein transferase
MARSQVATPSHLIDGPVYSELVKAGFRRSGAFTYRPTATTAARACRCASLPRNFAPTACSGEYGGSTRGLEATVHDLKYSPEHYALYLRYQSTRHSGGGMDQDSGAISPFPAAEQRRLAFDRIPRARGAAHGEHPRRATGRDVVGLYFLRPGIASASFGTFNILWQIECA